MFHNHRRGENSVLTLTIVLILGLFVLLKYRGSDVLTDSSVIDTSSSEQREGMPGDSSAHANEQGSYAIKTVTYTTENVEIQYPQISEMQDTAVQDKLNEMIKDYVMSVYQKYADVQEIMAHEITYEVTYSDSLLLSIRFSGYNNYAQALYPNKFLFSLNIDLIAQKPLKLYDLVTINDGFLDLFRSADYIGPINEYTAELKTAIENSLDMDNRELTACLNNADVADDSINTGGVYSYLTDDTLVVSIAVPHALGDYAEFIIKRSNLTDAWE
jgi:hypothetical protein